MKKEKVLHDRRIKIWSTASFALKDTNRGPHKDPDMPIDIPKNSGHLWLAYTELQGSFNMLQFISVDSGHFTQPELWL